MPWNNNHTLLTGPISLADLSWAAGLAGPPYKIGNIIKNGAFNPMAKHKAFKSSARGYAYDKNQSTPELRSPDRVAAAETTYYGMGSPRQLFAAQILEGSGLYSYEKPTVGAPNEIFRPQDFDGYVTGAISPFRLMADDSVYRGDPLYLFVGFNSSAQYVYNYEGRPDTWQGDYNLSIADLLRSYYRTSYYLAFIIVDADGAGHNTNLVIFNRNIVDACQRGINTLALYPNGNGTYHPQIPILKNASVGQHFKIVGCWTTWPTDVSPAYDYCVFEGPSYGNMLYSFQFVENMDRWSFMITQTPPEITGSITAFTMYDMGIVPYFSVYTMHQFRVDSLTAIVTATQTARYIFEVTLYSSTSQSSIGELPQYPDYHLIPSGSYTIQVNLTAGVQTSVDLTDNQYYVYLLDHASDYIVASVKAYRSGQPSDHVGDITCPIQGY